MTYDYDFSVYESVALPNRYKTLNSNLDVKYTCVKVTQGTVETVKP